MPPALNIDGLPEWLKIISSLTLLALTVWVAIRGYSPKSPSRQLGENSQIIGAQIADMGAIRHLSDVAVEQTRAMRELEASVGHLERTLQDDIHWRRRANEVGEELNKRLRELREVLEGSRR